MERYETPLVVTLGPGEPTPRIHFARDSVTLDELSARLEKLREGGAQAKAIVLLQTDTGTPVGIEREVTEMVLAKGFRLALVGKNAPASPIPSPKPTSK